VTAVGDDVRQTRTIHTAFVQMRVGGAFSEALVRTPASANDVHSEEGAALKAALRASARTWERHVRVPLLENG
jgi:hypothetical protein